MKLLNMFKAQNKKTNLDVYRSGKVIGFYQDSIEKIGRDQFKKLVEKGLSIPVFALWIASGSITLGYKNGVKKEHRFRYFENKSLSTKSNALLKLSY